MDELFVHERYLSLVRLARQLVDDLPTAEDVVQEVLARMLQGSSATPVRDPLAYARAAVVNGCRSELRARKGKRTVSLGVDLPELTEEHGQSDGELGGDGDELLAAIDQLPRRQREIVVLRYYQDLSINEIAEALEITPHAVSASHFLALKTLRTGIHQNQSAAGGHR
ncbi:MAG: RNA polymerase sigma factor [Nakamurella sp.]